MGKRVELPGRGGSKFSDGRRFVEGVMVDVMAGLKILKWVEIVGV